MFRRSNFRDHTTIIYSNINFHGLGKNQGQIIIIIRINMIRKGNQYRDSINDGRQVWIDGEKVKDICNHPSLKPIIDILSLIHI